MPPGGEQWPPRMMGASVWSAPQLQLSRLDSPQLSMLVSQASNFGSLRARPVGLDF